MTTNKEQSTAHVKHRQQMWAEADADTNLRTKLQRVTNICNVLYYKANKQCEKEIYARNLQILVEQQSSTTCIRNIMSSDERTTLKNSDCEKLSKLCKYINKSQRNAEIIVQWMRQVMTG